MKLGLDLNLFAIRQTSSCVAFHGMIHFLDTNRAVAWALNHSSQLGDVFSSCQQTGLIAPFSRFSDKPDAIRHSNENDRGEDHNEAIV